MITRIASLNKFNGVLLGRDLAGIFKEGHVYSVTEVMGVIMVNDLGKHAVSDHQKRGASIGQCATEGVYCLTEDEYKAQLKSNHE